MNDFFCTIGNKLSDKIPEKPNPLLSNEYELGNTVRNFSFKAVSENDVTKVMKKMKTSHGSGCDGIASFFIKIALPLISGSLCDLFNLSLFSGKFPTNWKIARVAPIYKSGARDDCSNYRPISVLPVLLQIVLTMLLLPLCSKILAGHQSKILSEKKQQR